MLTELRRIRSFTPLCDGRTHRDPSPTIARRLSWGHARQVPNLSWNSSVHSSTVSWLAEGRRRISGVAVLSHKYVEKRL